MTIVVAREMVVTGNRKLIQTYSVMVPGFPGTFFCAQNIFSDFFRYFSNSNNDS